MNSTQRGHRRMVVLAATCLIPWAASYADPVKLPKGMRVVLELQHHVTSGYLPTGAPIYFRVAEDTLIDGKTMIRKGTLVTGKMEQSSSRGMVGHSGSMSLGVRSVQAVDGSSVPVEADLAKQGRSRAGATVAWSLFWGLPGLITKGVNPYLERGSVIEADVLADSMIDPALDPTLHSAPAPEETMPAAKPLSLIIKNFKFESGSTDKLKFDIERNKNLKTVTFQVVPDASITDPAGSLATAHLVAVDGMAVPFDVPAKSSTAKSMTYDGWSIVEFCRDGVTELTFRGTTASGQPYEGMYPMHVKVAKKG